MKKFFLSAVVMFVATTTGVYAQSNSEELNDEFANTEMMASTQNEGLIPAEDFNIAMCAYNNVPSSVIDRNWLNWFFICSGIETSYIYGETENFYRSVEILKQKAPEAYAYAEQLAENGTLPDYTSQFPLRY